MTTTRCPNTDFDNSNMTAEGFEILAIETYHFADGLDETEIIWARTAPAHIAEHELPY